MHLARLFLKQSVEYHHDHTSVWSSKIHYTVLKSKWLGYAVTTCVAKWTVVAGNDMFSSCEHANTSQSQWCSKLVLAFSTP